MASFLTAAVGIGGGTLLLAVMAQVLPVNALIPVHGVVQLGSNAGRALLMARDINLKYALWFVGGSLVGAIIGGQIVVTLADVWLKLILGVFILYSVWGPKFSSHGASAYKLGFGGTISTLLTMFVGATGPFVVAYLRALALKPMQLVATSAACMVAQHLLKVLVFGLLGFAFSPYLGLMVLMIAVGLLGTLLGRKVLLSINETLFMYTMNAVLTLLALRILYSSFTSS